MFRVFVRSWWRKALPSDGRWPNNLVPNAGGRKTTLRKVHTEAEAQQVCKEYNDSHNPGKYSRKAEYVGV